MKIKAENIKPYTFLSDKYRVLLDDLIDKVKSGPFRPMYHIAPPSGLLNDPNGLSYFNGKYHIFYQWYPFGAKHDMKHWNHVTSDDLVNFQEEREILIPDQEYEKNGCYSGNAFVKDDQCYLFYTANYKDEHGVKVPMQALAIMDKDGKIVKSNDNPILKGSPEGIGHNIRDPFVFEKDDTYYMLLGSETTDQIGALLLYASKNLLNWDYQGSIKVFLDGHLMELGTFVECPGLIQVDDQDILFLSLIGSDIENTVKENRFVSFALIGELDISALEFRAKKLQTLDYGFDYYAPQPFRDENGSATVISWFGCGDQILPEDVHGWRHALTLPRHLVLEDNTLKTPVYPAFKEVFKKVELEGNDVLYESSTDPERLVWKIGEGAHRLRVGSEDDYYTIRIEPGKFVEIDRSGLKTKIDPDYGMIRRIPIEDVSELELYLDNSFNELYLNEGEAVASFRSYEMA